MSQLILIRHAHSITNSVIEAMRCDPLYRAFRSGLAQERSVEKIQAIARELHCRYRPPDDINMAELSPKGARQIETLSRFLLATKVQPRNIWCSPLVRASSTLERLCFLCPDFSNAKITFDNRLIERQRGETASKFVDLQLYLSLNPQESTRKNQCPPLRYAPPSGECLNDVRIRTALSLREILAALHYGDALVITHHCVINSLRSQLERWPESDFLKRLTGDKPPNCGAIAYRSAGNDVELVCCSW